ncbi:MAG: NapC/NirT family cytochrome c, partial [bacterium]
MKSENASNGAGNGRTWLYNWLALTGIALVFSGAAGFLFVFLAGLVMSEPPSYLSLMFIPLPLLAGVGVVMVLASVWVDARRKKAGKPPLRRRFRLDLANPSHLWVLLGFLSGGLVTIVLLFTVSVKAFEVLESNEFCGGMCHSVMRPEFTTYKFSSHARVKCVECHIGSGAEWFVRSKLSGLRQVAAVALNSFPRPIPTP